MERRHPDLKHLTLRGHLCSRCMSLLALAEDDKVVLQQAIGYLEVDHLEKLP